MFQSAVQPPILSLFSSASTDCLSLFSTHTDTALPSDSFIHILDDESCLPEPASPKTLIKPMLLDESEDHEFEQDTSNPHGLAICDPVLHLQSPTVARACIRCPPLHWNTKAVQRRRDLGIKLGWMHIQVRNMGREWCFEVGVVDQSGREGRVRCSTFQKQPRLRTASSEPPLLHIPLKFPPLSSRPLTAWCTISFHIPSAMPHFSSLSSQRTSNLSNPEVPLPSNQFSHVSFVKIFATCRLRRVWFTAEKRDAFSEPWEFGLYAR